MEKGEEPGGPPPAGPFERGGTPRWPRWAWVEKTWAWAVVSLPRDVHSALGQFHWQDTCQIFSEMQTELNELNGTGPG